MNQKGFAPIIIIILVALLIGGGAYMAVKYQKPFSNVSVPVATSTVQTNTSGNNEASEARAEAKPLVATTSSAVPSQKVPATKTSVVPSGQTLRLRFTGTRFFNGYGISESNEVYPIQVSSTFLRYGNLDSPIRLGVIYSNLDDGSPGIVRTFEITSVPADNLTQESDVFFRSGNERFTSSIFTLSLPAYPHLKAFVPTLKVATSSGFSVEVYTDEDKNQFFSNTEASRHFFKDFIHLFYFAEQPDAKSTQEGAHIGWNVVHYTTTTRAYAQPFASVIDVEGILGPSSPVLSKEQAEYIANILKSR